MKILINTNTDAETTIYPGEEIAAAAQRVDACRGDTLQIVDVVYETVQNGSRMIAGSTQHEPIMVRREVSRTPMRTWRVGRK